MFGPLGLRRIPELLLTAVLGLAGCQQMPDVHPQDLTQNMVTTYANGTTPPSSVQRAVLVPGGNLSLVTVRVRPDLATAAGNREILCTAPSPDWATAYAFAQSLAANGGVTGGASGAISASNNSSETISMMAGRTAGVVALRDGLYNACQAYANGVIGKDAYALILSQYGNLLVALAGSGGGGGGSSSSSTSGSASSSSGPPAGVAVAVSTAPASAAAPASPAAASTNSGGSSGANSTTAQMQMEILQGMMVACLSENDRSVVDPTQINPLLNDKACASLLANIASGANKLMAPAASSGGSGQTKAAAVATPR